MIEYRADRTMEYGKSNGISSKLWYDLELFFYNCYQAQTFMGDFEQNCITLNKSEFYEKYCE